MKYATENDKLTVYPEGSLDAGNADDLREEIEALIVQTGAKSLELDFASITHISSSGLRIVLHFLKRLGDVTVIDATNDVYDAFEKTGITQQMVVRRQLRCISVEGCEVIGKGQTATLYRLDADTVVKVYSKAVFTSLAMVQHDFDVSRAIFVAGIPSAIVHEIVRVGDEYGVVFEFLKARDFWDVLAEDREHLAEWATRFARLLRDAHQIPVDTKRFMDFRYRLTEAFPALVGKAGTQEEIDAFVALCTALPERPTFLHADCHPGNFMVRDDAEFVFIDLSSVCSGHPISDLAAMWIAFRMHSLEGREAYEAQRVGDTAQPLDFDETILFWNAFVAAYLDTDDEALIAQVETEAEVYGMLRMVFIDAAMYGHLTETTERYKERVLDYAAHPMPIGF